MRIAQGDTQDRATPFIPPRASDPKMESFLGSDPMLHQWLEHRWTQENRQHFSARCSGFGPESGHHFQDPSEALFELEHRSTRKTANTFPRDALEVSCGGGSCRARTPGRRRCCAIQHAGTAASTREAV